MTRTTEDLIRRSLVRTLRAGNVLSGAGLTGGEHEDVAPRGSKYPFLTYRTVAAPYDDDWDHRTIRSWFDVEIWAEDQVVASSLDSVAMNLIEDSLLPIEVVDPGPPPITTTLQTILYCRRIAGLRSKEVTDEGKTIYRIGGTYAIWTDQPL